MTTHEQYEDMLLSPLLFKRIQLLLLLLILILLVISASETPEYLHGFETVFQSLHSQSEMGTKLILGKLPIFKRVTDKKQ